VKSKLAEVMEDVEKFQSESQSLRETRDFVVAEHVDTQRRLEVLTEFFNKKEAELQKQLGLQSARFGDVATDSESQARQLTAVTSELDSTAGQLKLVRGELDDQERSLKAAVAAQEKKAHENWVAARQAERKLTELQGEMSVLRNRLTQVEAKGSLLEQEKSDLEGTVVILQSQHVNVKQEAGSQMNGRPPSSLEGMDNGALSSSNSMNESSSFKPITPTADGPQSLPRLPGLPELPGMGSLTSPLSSLPPAGMSMPTMMNPMMTSMGMMGGLPAPTGTTPSMFPSLGGLPPSLLDSRPPPLGRMSPAPKDRNNRTFDSRSPSPEYGDRYGRETRRYSSRNERDSSPGSRSERRISPSRRGPSPTRSERGHHVEGRERYDNRYQNGGRRDSREMSPDRYSSRSDRSDRGGVRVRDNGARYNVGDRHDHRTGHQRTEYLKEPAAGPKTSSPSEPQQVRNYGP